jgi:hypothetical protein
MQSLPLTIALHRAADALAGRDVCTLENWLDRLDAKPPDNFARFARDVFWLENALVSFAMASRDTKIEIPVFTTKGGDR